MAQPSLSEFEKRCKNLQIKVDASDNYSQMKADYDALYRMLMELSSELSSYDKERCQSRADSLLKQIGERESSGFKGSKTFRFQRKPKATKRAPRLDASDLNESQKAPVTTDKHFFVTEPTVVYERLDHCLVTTEKDSTTAQSGSLTLHSVNHSLVRFQPLTFQSGSIFITDCESSTIVCDLPPQNAVQVRLRNLRNCKLILNAFDSTTKQIVILENCAGCIFHQTTEERLIIQNFTNLNLTESTQQDYKFELFDVLDKLKRADTN